MKKILAMILCAVLFFGCAAFAEEAAEKELMGTLEVHNSFNLKCRLPEGYKLGDIENDDVHILADIASADAAKPKIRVSVAFNEEYTREDGTALKLNEVDPEILAEIKDSFITDGNMTDVTVEEAETAYGTKLFIVRGRVVDEDMMIFYSIYKSYEVEVVVIPGEEDKDGLNEEQVRTVIDFLSDMDFEEV